MIDMKELIIAILIVLFLYIIITISKSKKEGFEDTTGYATKSDLLALKADYQAIQNISSMYNNGKFKFSDVEITGNLITTGDATIGGNISTPGDANIGKNMNAGSVFANNPSRFRDTLYIGGEDGSKGDLSVGRNMTVKNDQTVEGTLRANGEVECKKSLGIILGTLTVRGTQIY